MYAGQTSEEQGRRIDADHLQAESAIVAHDIAEFVLAQHAVIDEDARQAVADGAVQQHGCHRRIDTARKTEDDAVVAQRLAQFGHGRFDETGRAPQSAAAADVHDKVPEQLRTLQCMKDFRMELHAPEGLVSGLIRGVFHRGRRGDAPESGRQPGDGVAVAHPDLRPVVEALEKRILTVLDVEHGPAVLTRAFGLPP